MQFEEPTRVAGFRKWQREFNRQVRKGEKAIYILAPVTRKNADGEKEVVGFKGAAVFDVSQTDPIPGKEEIPVRCPGKWDDTPRSGDLFDELTQVAEALGSSVSVVDRIHEAPTALACWRPTDKAILVTERAGGNEGCAALAHEISHHIDLHVFDNMDDTLGYEGHKMVRELVAESCAFLVMDGHDLDCAPASESYLAAFASTCDDPAQALSAVAGRVLAVTARIEEELANVREPDRAHAAA